MTAYSRYMYKTRSEYLSRLSNASMTANKPHSDLEQARKFLQRARIASGVGLLVSLPFTFFLGGYMVVAITVLIVCTVVAFVHSWTKRKEIRVFAVSVSISLLLVIGTALISFYGTHTEVRQFDTGGTWVSSKQPGQALYSATFLPGTFTAALLGFDCNNAYGPNCSDPALFFGIGIDYTVLVGGVVTGNLLARRNLRMKADRVAGAAG